MDLETLPPKGKGTVAVTVTLTGPGGVGEDGEFGDDGAEATDVAESSVDDAVVPEPPLQLSNPVAAIINRASIADTCILRKRTLSLLAVRSPSTAIENSIER